MNPKIDGHFQIHMRKPSLSALTLFSIRHTVLQKYYRTDIRKDGQKERQTEEATFRGGRCPPKKVHCII